MVIAMEWSKEKLQAHKDFIKEENKKMGWFARFKTKYWGLKYRIEDWLNGE